MWPRQRPRAHEFLGHRPTDAGAHKLSLVQSCRLAGVDPFLYVRDVLRRLPSHPQRCVGELTPRRWAAALAKTDAAA